MLYFKENCWRDPLGIKVSGGYFLPVPYAGYNPTGGLHHERSHILVCSGSKELVKNGTKMWFCAEQDTVSCSLEGLERSFEAILANFLGFKDFFCWFVMCFLKRMLFL